jgi:predicted NUDIX family NTP pyrophosphohydrolase
VAITTSAGILLYRHGPQGLELLLAHPGGPYWSRRDDGAWTLPKGEVDPGEDPLAAALRELTEETGFAAEPPYLPLGEVRMRSGKRVIGWAARGDADPAMLRSNRFELEWPPKSGRMRSFPEVDRAAWFTPEQARVKLLPAQSEFVLRLQKALEAAS